MSKRIEKFKLLYDYYDGNGKKYEFNGTVSVGNYGTIFSHQAKRGKKNISGCFKYGRPTEMGYLQVVITDIHGNKGWFYVHRLVATVWLKRKSHQIDVMHLDDDPNNNHISNIRWCTTKENMEDKIKKGRANLNGRTKWPDDVLIDIYMRRQRGESKKSIKFDYPEIKDSTFSHYSSGNALRLRGLIQ